MLLDTLHRLAASRRRALSLRISISFWVYATVQHVAKQDKRIASPFRYSNHATNTSLSLLIY